jgi:hypothetical protein
MSELTLITKVSSAVRERSDLPSPAAVRMVRPQSSSSYAEVLPA